MRTLLGRIVAAHRAGQPPLRSIPVGYLVRLTQAFHDTPAEPGAATAMPGLVDPLTGRELEVLARLAAGVPNQAIAEELFVTLFTVKKHVSHVLAKLGAGNRTQAVARARALGLLSHEGSATTRTARR